MRVYVVLFAFLSALLGGCSSTSEYKAVYEAEAADVASLEVPPGLSRPEGNGGVAPELEQGITSYSGYQQNVGTGTRQEFIRKFENMRFVRDGGLYWVEVQAGPEDVWNDVRDYFSKLGFKFTEEKPHLGLLQTDWQENRVGLPSGLFGFLGKLYSAELMDSYRIRLEYDDQKELTRIFISHRGVREVYESEPDNISIVGTKWVVRPSEPELELEMLMRFMAFRGMDEEMAKQVIAEARGSERATLRQEQDTTVLEFNEGFSRAWRYVGIALDRLGVLVEDRNRSAGVYYIQLPETFVLDNKQSGFFAGLFSQTRKPLSDKYILKIEGKGETSDVLVRPRGEAAEDFEDVTRKLLTDIKDNIL